MRYQHSRPKKRRSAVTLPSTLVALCGITAAIAGCAAGSGGPGPGSAAVASLPGQSGLPARQPAATDDAAIRPGHGEFRTLHASARGRDVRPLPPARAQRAEHRNAHAGCRDKAGATPNASTSSRRSLTSSRQARQLMLAPNLPALTRYAQCMRSHDIGLLDPTAQGQVNLGSVAGISSDFGRYSPQFRAADTACRHFLPAGVSDNGTGP